MNILVTGGAGFIGSHVSEAYVRLGHHVWIVDDLSTGSKANVPQGATLCPWDIADEEVGALLAREKIELINHHAAHVDIRESVVDAQGEAKVNILGLLSLLDAACKAGVRRIIFASTGGAVYGEQEEFPAPETHPAKPRSPYGVSKLAGEKYLECYEKVHGIVPQILRYSNVYGPRQNPLGEAGVVAIFAAKMLQGQSPLIHGTGAQTRDFVCVEDVVAANVLALDRAESCLFNVGTGKETDILTVFRHLERLTGFSGRCLHDEPKSGEQARSAIDPGRIEKAWGWRPKVSLVDGLAKTVDWFRREAAIGVR